MITKTVIIFALHLYFSSSSLAFGSIDKEPVGSPAPDVKILRGVGVNYFNAISRSINRPNDRSYRQGLKTLSKYEIPFVRVMFGSYWPVEMELYRTNRTLYFEILDDFVHTAEEEHIGIVANLCWNYPTIPDMVGEPVSAWGNKNSKTTAFYRQYTRDVVSRYRNSSAIWMWEFSNEMSLYVDLPNASEWRSPIDPKKGTPKIRTKADELTSQDMLVAMSEFRDAVRTYDMKTPISSGNALPRPYAYHNSFERTWKHDTESQLCQILARDNPVGFDVISIHIYPKSKSIFGNYDEKLRPVRDCAKKLGKYVFVGEFGAGEKDGFRNIAGVKAVFQELNTALIENEIYLSALWVYDFSFQEGSYNVTEKNSRAYQLEEIRAINRKLKGLVKGRK